MKAAYKFRAHAGNPLALPGVLAIITEVDGAVAALWQDGIVRRHEGAPDDLQLLLVAGNHHTDMIWKLHHRFACTPHALSGCVVHEHALCQYSASDLISHGAHVAD